MIPAADHGQLAEVRRDRVARPFFSVCIPQYNRTSFLLKVLESLEAQTWRRFEVCISDDCSDDGREQEVLAFLEGSQLSFVYRRRESNGRYDTNLRSSIALARGEYCFLLGNDDVLAGPSSLDEYHAEIARAPDVGVASANFVDAQSGATTRRVLGTRVLPGGADTAARSFRNFSFLSGVVLRRERAQFHATERWDGSEMYQTYLAVRIIAEGHNLLYVDRVIVRMGVQVEGEQVDSTLRRAKIDPCPIVERSSTLSLLGRLVADALQPYTAPDVWRTRAERVLTQLYVFPYAYWIVTYRRVQSWRFALGICLGMRPRNVIGDLPLSRLGRLRLILLYAIVSAAGLGVPIGLFTRSQSVLQRIAKAST